MSLNPDAVPFSPPLRSAWRVDTGSTIAVAGNDTLYGIKGSGRIAAFRGADGVPRWETSGTYLPNRLVRQGNRLFAFRSRQGLAYIDDLGTSASEFVAISFGATPEANIAAPVIDGRWVYLAVNQGLYTIHQDEGLQYALVLEGPQPFGVGLLDTREIVVVNGQGVPSRYRVGDSALELVWNGRPHGLRVGQAERPFIIAGNRLILGIDSYTIAYDLTNGTVAWTLSDVPARAFAVQGDYVYVAFHGATLWAVHAASGAIAWRRQYVYDIGLQGPYGIALAGDYLYFGGNLQRNPDGALLLAVKAVDGSFTWHSRSITLPWAGGTPVMDGNRLYVYSNAHTGSYTALPSAPLVDPQTVEITPRPLRGPAAEFGAGRVRVNMPVAARVSLAPYREVQGLGTAAVLRVNWGTGMREASWSPSGAGGFTDQAQFGYMLMDVEESSGLAYTQALVLPVNAFPDVMGHWAQNAIEVMVYHKFVSGYPDQTFKPDNLVTRAEVSTIIAKTLGLNAPSPGFRTNFTDIGTHWARDSIIALEERGVIGGFAEPDGTFTFRPDLNMTRAQQARVLVRAYSIAAAPTGFETRFTDISAHWAAADIKALEAAGYVQGFRESNGTYTYRPEQNLTRAEMCTIVVRIRNLSR